jgi:hypothetical protein
MADFRQARLTDRDRPAQFAAGHDHHAIREIPYFG